MEYAIETFSLTKIFADWWGRNRVVAVDDLNLKVRTNEVYGFLGPNGSGKTTTLKMLLGLLHPTKGKALVLEGDATDPQINRRIGFLPEESYLYKYLTARETLDFYGQLFKLPARVRKMRIEALLDMVGLKAVANRTVGTFSKGMARRIGLAQALINDPELLILDEPTTGLDPLGTRQIKDLIIELAKRGKTVLLCSHLLADVEDVCDRIAILYGGRIQAEGNVRDLLRHSDKTEITTGRLSPAALEKIKQMLAEERAEYTIGSPLDKLETFFINIVARAQQQAVPTSGAESRTQISEFLSAKTDERARREAILNQLVSASPSDEQTAATDTQNIQPQPVPATPADENLLIRLTEQVDSKPVTTQPTKAKPEPAISDQPDKSILDELTGRPSPDKKNTHPGDSANA
ncbi:MAG: ABC transporter ATP-binding protein [Sedimentisphaerales bacterium]|jgi:ABC-2 type transport system ATP-binding protein